MRRSVVLACIVLTPGVAFNPNNQARLRMQQGFGKQSQSKTPAKLKTPAKAPPPAVPKQTPVRAGELPEDAFSQFPPLTQEQKQTLEKAPGGKATDFPVEVADRIRERHGFEHFDEKLFPGIRLLHADPVVFEVEGFFTPQECDAYIAMSTLKKSGRRKGGLAPTELQSATTSSQFQQQRTSTTWFHHYASAPELVAKASLLLGVDDYCKWEEPQTVRYRPGERFNWHLDALPPSECGASKGGQRTATVLVYLTNMHANGGGATAFRDLGPLRVRPKKGKCLVFFPSFGGEAGSPFDSRVLHAGEVVGQGNKAKEKYIAQLWCHKKPYPPSVPEGSSHEAAEKPIVDYVRRFAEAGVSLE
ncbi:unnamed protein product [Ectocarpus sp. 6 AP-2014]